MSATPNPVPMLDLKAQYETIREEVNATIERVVRSQCFTLGPEVRALEEELAAYCQTSHAIGVSSGTDALLAVLMALDIGPGDEVITTPFTFFATAGVISRLGATPTFVDIRRDDFTIDPEQIEAAITRQTKAIMPVHLYGQCADMDAINAIADKHGIAVIEDAAQAIGAEYNERRAGSLGGAGCLSFYPSKNLGAFGDAGAITTNDTKLFEKLRLLRVHGARSEYRHDMVGGNFRIDEIQAAVLRVKLRHLDSWTELRQQKAATYEAMLVRSRLAGSLVITPPQRQNRHVFNQFVIRASERDELQAFLGEHGIGCRVYYPVPLHVQQCFASLGYRAGDLPESERAANETLALPIYPELTTEQQQRVVEAIESYYAATNRLPMRRAA